MDKENTITVVNGKRMQKIQFNVGKKSAFAFRIGKNCRDAKKMEKIFQILKEKQISFASNQIVVRPFFRNLFYFGGYFFENRQ